MRKKKNLLPRLARCESVAVPDPASLAGRWRERFGRPENCRLALEIGCGKGAFITAMSEKYPETAFVALERVPEAIVMSMEKACGKGLSNLLFISDDAANLDDFFAPGELDDLYINFCDPWSPKKHAKRRLTHRGFLSLYNRILSPDGLLHFKTDNRKLFEFSVCELSHCGFRLKTLSTDLHASETDNVMTEYEAKFSALGMPIYHLEADRFNPEEAAQALSRGPETGGRHEPEHAR